MADLDKLYGALEQADAAGDTDSAQEIASMIREAKAASAAPIAGTGQSSYPGESVVDAFKAVPKGFEELIGSANDYILNKAGMDPSPIPALPGAQKLYDEAKARSPNAAAIGKFGGGNTIPMVAGGGAGGVVQKGLSGTGKGALGLLRNAGAGMANAVTSGGVTGFLSPEEGDKMDHAGTGAIMGGVIGGPLNTVGTLMQGGKALWNSELIRKYGRRALRSVAPTASKVVDLASDAVGALKQGASVAEGTAGAAIPSVKETIVKEAGDYMSKSPLTRVGKTAFNKNLDEIVSRPGMTDDVSKGVAARLRKELAGGDKNTASHLDKLRTILDDAGLTPKQKAAFTQVIDDHVSEATGGMSQIAKLVLDDIGEEGMSSAAKIEEALRKQVAARRISQVQADRYRTAVSAGAAGSAAAESSRRQE